MHMQKNIRLGVSLNVIASAFFASQFAYTQLLSELDGEEIYAWRIALAFPFLTILIVTKGYWQHVVNIYNRVLDDGIFLLTRLLSAFLVGIQLWLFTWAPVNGYGLAVSLGYFILPITMVAVGWLVLKDHMSRFQKLACLFALCGVLNQLVISKTLSWPTLVVCLGYPVYFWLRHKTDTNHISSTWVDLMLSLPVCGYFVFQGGHVLQSLTVSSNLLWLVFGLGIISALALAFQSLSAPHLSLSLFGLLAYVEPVMLLIVSIVLGETISTEEWPTYIAIWLAVSALVIEGCISLKRSPTIELRAK